MVIAVRPVQYPNALGSMEITELGISIEVKLLQPLNALYPIVVTEFGMTVFLQPETNSLVLVLIMALQFSRESYTIFPGATMICSRPIQ